MRIISWNVNGIRATAKKWELQNLIESEDPDIVFMQEIKAQHDKLTDDLLSPLPYIAHYNPAEKPGYAGTGVWIHSRVYDTHDIEWLTSFPWDPTASEGRVAHITMKRKETPENITDIADIIDVFGIYFPNGGKSEQAWQDKLVFYSEFGKYMDSLRALWHEVVWGGDINCAHHAIDLARAKENDGKIGFHPSERAWLDNRVEESWHDIWREANPEVTDMYSYWDVITRSRARNVGWRIDAWWGSDSISRDATVRYLTEQMWSDHCPIVVDIAI